MFFRVARLDVILLLVAVFDCSRRTWQRAVCTGSMIRAPHQSAEGLSNCSSLRVKNVVRRRSTQGVLSMFRGLLGCFAAR
jgi:hypothetical protein